MDIQKLITLGRLEKDVTISGMKFHYVTPPTDAIIKVVDNYDMVTLFVTKIDDQDIVTPEQKADLKKALQTMQLGVVNALIEQCTKLSEEQSQIINEDLTKK